MIEITLPIGVYSYDEAKPIGDRGGFGQVFEGKHSDGRQLAVKRLNDSSVDAIHREKRIVERLQGKSFEYVIPFIDSGFDEQEASFFLVMELAETSLQNHIVKGGHLQAKEVAGVMLEIAKGLVEVGELVHRDLKPQNVLLHEGKWKIADFGISKFIDEATSNRTFKGQGSERYTAPEQWRFETATHRTDVYALGHMGFFMLTGDTAFTSDFSNAHQTRETPDFECGDPGLASLIRTMTKKPPDARPSTLRVVQRLESILAGKAQNHSVNSLHLLASASNRVSQEEAKRMAAVEAAKIETRRRYELSSNGIQILSDISERLWQTISENSDGARRRSELQGDETIVSLGHASVSISTIDKRVGAASFPHSKWDVIVSANILLSQEPDKYCWGSSLWYMKLPETVDYRWYEVGYMTRLLSNSRHIFEPFALANPTEADKAVPFGGGKFQIAFGPTPIDDEFEQEFCQRWCELLARATEKSIRFPTEMPIHAWPPQW